MFDCSIKLAETILSSSCSNSARKYYLNYLISSCCRTILSSSSFYLLKNLASPRILRLRSYIDKAMRFVLAILRGEFSNSGAELSSEWGLLWNVVSMFVSKALIYFAIVARST